MKLLQSPLSERLGRKRKCEFDEDPRSLKRFFVSPTLIAADVMQDDLQKKFISTGVTTLSTSHCKKYPITGEIVDGLCPHPFSMSTIPAKSPPCGRCLSGQSGHWKHVAASP